jgi:inosine-uridine nucleoside N-ribohydrolase
MQKRLLNHIPFFSFLILCLLFTGCTGTDEKLTPSPVKIIFDTDMGSDCDDAGALALLHAYADMGKAEIVGCIYSSGKVPYGAGITEAINVYHERPFIPVGASHDLTFGDPVDKMTAEKLAKDTSAFGNRIIHNYDAEEQTILLRKLLSAQEDSSVTYVTVGHTRALYELLISEPDGMSSLNGHELISKKVKRWVALGALGAKNSGDYYTKDWNFFFNGTAQYTYYLVNNFPVQVFFVDAGANVFTGKSLKTTPPGNIVRTAYRDWLWNVENKTLSDQRPSWDLAAIYYAVEGTGEFLENTGQGHLEFDIEKGSKWIEKIEAGQFYIRQKEGVEESFAAYLNKMIVN